MTLEELQELNDLISPLILNGQPLSRIFAVQAVTDEPMLISNVSLPVDKKIPLLAGQFKVSPDEVMLKPALINK